MAAWPPFEDSVDGGTTWVNLKRVREHDEDHNGSLGDRGRNRGAICCLKM